MVEDETVFKGYCSPSSLEPRGLFSKFTMLVIKDVRFEIFFVVFDDL